jgi:serine/threonine protein kinase
VTGALDDVGAATFGRYTLLRRLASGGMAEVHLASFEGAAGVRKLVAIKRILPEHEADDEFVAMFTNEARIAATLHHANVVQAYDFGCEGGSHFLAMEYLRGQDVRRIVRELARTGRPLPLDVAMAIGIGAAAGLHYLHEKRDAAGTSLGLVHRDVSPTNLFLTSDGIVKLVDFGIAKAARRSGDTQVGMVKGKIAYMSPEQSRAEAIDRRSDIFSLSIVLWELTVGRRLFQGSSDEAVMSAIGGLEVPRPSQMAPRYPRELERIVMKGLARDPDRRYETAEALQTDLEAFARGEKLAVTQGSVSKFLRSLDGDDEPELTIAAMEPDPEIAGTPRRGTRVLRHRTGARRSGRLLVALGAVAVGGLTGALGIRWRHGSEGSAAVTAVSIQAPPPIAASSPVAEAPPVATAVLPARSEPAPVAAHKKRGRARAERPSQPPTDSAAPAVDRWTRESPLPPSP